MVVCTTTTAITYKSTRVTMMAGFTESHAEWVASQSGSPTWEVKETPSSLDWPLQGSVQAIRCGVPSAAHTISPEKTCGSFQPLKAMLPFCRLSLRKTHPEQVVKPSSPACVLPVGRGVELLQDDGEQVEVVPSQIPQTPPGHQLARDEPSGSAVASTSDSTLRNSHQWITEFPAIESQSTYIHRYPQWHGATPDRLYATVIH